MKIKRSLTVLPLLTLLLGADASLATAESQEPDPPATTAEDDEANLTRKERKQRAKEARIAEYLRKKEEKLARREMAQAGRLSEQENQARAMERRQLAQAGQEETETLPQTEPTMRPTGSLPRELARAQQRVRTTRLGSTPDVMAYLDMIDEQRASPDQLAAFGNYLSMHGMDEEAIAYYDVAVRIKPDDPILWLNLGTLQRRLQAIGAAQASYERALSIDPNNAMAHYNLGAVLDAQGRYDAAIAEYRTALLLEPELGEADYNPQSANNERLMAVKMMIYKEKSGSLGLPLVDVRTRRLPGTGN